MQMAKSDDKVTACHELPTDDFNNVLKSEAI